MSLNFKMLNEINLENYNYKLPRERIAEFPLEDRAMSKLMYVNAITCKIEHRCFNDIPELLSENSLLVVNETRVIAARLLMKKQTGGSVELLCVEPIEPSFEPQIVMNATGKCKWKCIVGGRRVKPAMKLQLFKNDSTLDFSAIVIERIENEALVEFVWKPSELSFAAVLEKIGITPLPPYIKRDALPSDKVSYQTIYAENDGSVAAPTAGLHFTEEIFERIAKKGIDTCKVSLHIGPGTFKPIEGNSIVDHNMHSERFSVSAKVIDKIIKHYKKFGEKAKVVATGTTSLRTLESLYWLGARLLKEGIGLVGSETESLNRSCANNKIIALKSPLPPFFKGGISFLSNFFKGGISFLFNFEKGGKSESLSFSKGEKREIPPISEGVNKEIPPISEGVNKEIPPLKKGGRGDLYDLNQWDSYKLEAEGKLPTAIEAYSSILDIMNKNNITEISGRTQLFIFPGYKFKIVNGLITNYHIPKSTLILLVASFLGDNLWRQAYEAALENDYRFLSYGDASLLMRY
ncbi:MAG: S-adenosylmethionine:tRNA ribosyltransferase-isomerase [Bacteroidota bacterium]|nr:S-adenosylmethionine:tRNA ribosyltransferase-isomerase [Bacteroidota bacterium]